MVLTTILPALPAPVLDSPTECLLLRVSTAMTIYERDDDVITSNRNLPHLTVIIAENKTARAEANADAQIDNLPTDQ
jgi:hypothetical protein